MNYFWILILSSTALASPMKIVTQELGSGYIYIPCSFDSHDEQCLLDTGSDITDIQDDSFSDAYPSVGKITGEGLSGQPTTCDLISVLLVGFGDGFASSPRLERCPPTVQGGQSVIGLSALSGKTLHFNFDNNDFSIMDVIPKGIAALPLTLHPLGHFGFPTDIAGVSADAVIDTGAAITTVDQSFVGAHPDSFTFVQTVPGQDANGDPVSLTLYVMKEISFGNVTLQAVNVLAGDFSAIAPFLPGVPLILGYNIIAQKNWYFDLLNKLWLSY